MNNDKLKQGLAGLETLLRDMNAQAQARCVHPEGESSPESEVAAVVTLTSSQGELVLGAASAARYGESVRMLWDAIATKGGLKLSLPYLAQRVEAAVFSAVDLRGTQPSCFEQRLRRAIDELAADLRRYPIPWLVTLRVHGVLPEGLPMHFGAVDFVPGNDECLRELHGLADRTPEEPGVAWGDGRTQRQRWHDELDSQFRGKVLARLTVEAADGTAALDAATTELRRTLDVLNFFAGQLLPMGCFAYLAGEASADTMLVIAEPQAATFSPKGRSKPARADGSATPVAAEPRHAGKPGETPFLLHPAGVFAPFAVAALPELARAAGLPTPDAILSLQGRSKDDDRVLTACAWAGRASVPRRTEESFLFYALALETLLLGGLGHEELSLRFRLRAAWLLGSDYSERQAVFDRMGALYGTRSAIVHHGRSSVTGMELGEMRLTALGAINRVLSTPEAWQQTGEKQPGLDQWFERQILGDAGGIRANTRCA